MLQQNCSFYEVSHNGIIVDISKVKDILFEIHSLHVARWSEICKIITGILLRDASWSSCLPDYRLKPLLRFISLLVVRDVRKQSRRVETLLVIRGRECVLRARDFERMKSAMRERLRTESGSLCACVCVYAEDETRGWSTRDSGKWREVFEGVKGVRREIGDSLPSRSRGHE